MDYNELHRYLLSEVGASTMDLIDKWIAGTGKLPTYDMSSEQVELAYRLKKSKS